VTLALLAALSLTLIPAVAQDEAVEPAAEVKPEVDLSGFPTLAGSLTHMVGHEFGYLRPKPGQPFELNLAKLDKLDKLSFDSGERQTYIPLPGPLRVESVHRYGNGEFQAMRLVAEAEVAEKAHRVTVDISVAPGAGHGPNYCHVWVVIEFQGITQGVARMDATASAKFPTANE
jgi:hypothetical protein